MTTAPHWSPVDDATADLLSLVANDQMHPRPAEEWDVFRAALVEAADIDGRVDQNDVRPLIRGEIEPKRIGAFYRRACLEGLLVADGYSISEDHDGRNAGRPMRQFRLSP